MRHPFFVVIGTPDPQRIKYILSMFRPSALNNTFRSYRPWLIRDAFDRFAVKLTSKTEFQNHHCHPLMKSYGAMLPGATYQAERSFEFFAIEIRTKSAR
jgi:hypothetical protein